MINQSVLLILPAKDFNEQEFLIVKDILERSQIKVFIASDSTSLCTGTDGLKVKNDVQFYNIHDSNFRAIIFIGGKGVKNYWDNLGLRRIVKKFHSSQKPIGAICSAVLIPAKAGIIPGKATCWPEDKTELQKEGIEFIDEPVSVNKNIITGRDPQAAAEFAKVFLHKLNEAG